MSHHVEGHTLGEGGGDNVGNYQDQSRGKGSKKKMVGKSIYCSFCGKEGVSQDKQDVLSNLPLVVWLW